jgi:hypothetical protein
MAGLILGKQQTSDFFGVMAQVAKDFLQTQLGKKFVPVLRWADRMTKDSVNSPIKPPGRRAIANATAYANDNAYDIAYAINNVIVIANAYANAINNVIANANAYANAINNVITKGTDSINSAILEALADTLSINNVIAAIAYPEVNAIAKLIEALVKLAELFQQDQIFSTVNYQPLSTKLREEQNFLNTEPQLTVEEFRERIKVIFQVWNQTFSLTPDLLNFKFGEIKDIDQQYFYIYLLMLDCQKIAPNLAPGVWAEIENGMLLP